ncbi:MAG: hypothetical protein EBR81_06050 [Proteobacteria bacterium]|nr:hypothetical protein [Pseudomonadota bacterium]
MLKPFEIFAKIPNDTASGIFGFLHEHQKPLYKSALETLTKSRNLRPVFLEKKPRVEQFAWLTEQVRRRQNDSMAAHVLQIWLVGAHKNLLCDFLDGFNIPHDENGTVESLPESPAREKLLEVINELRTRYDGTLLAIYMNTFQSLDPSAWPTLSALIEEDPTLQLH